MIDDFIERKWGRTQGRATSCPSWKRCSKETLGVIVYQEQVMQISNVLAGYSLGDADLLRRAMGKKNAEEMAKQRERFVERRRQSKASRKDKVEKIFDLMEKFAGYGFNKSHSAAYALLAYHTAYLKTHYPVEFMAALLTSETGKPEKVVKYINECREMGIAVEPPDVQVSGRRLHARTARPSASASPRSRTWAATPSIRSWRRARSWPRRRRRLPIALGVLREGRSARDEQARDRVADQGGSARLFRAARAAHGRCRQGDGARAEGAARSCSRAERTLRRPWRRSSTMRPERWIQ